MSTIITTAQQALRDVNNAFERAQKKSTEIQTQAQLELDKAQGWRDPETKEIRHKDGTYVLRTDYSNKLRDDEDNYVYSSKKFLRLQN